jgi:arylsulfatase A-like enzyme
MQPAVIFVVLDTVRADHLSLCGYERPTSPQLERLVARPGASSSCRTYAPGDWTLPSHASFFTGIDASRHGARIASDGPVLAHINVAPLASSYSTLAEQLKERGYQTLAVSGNPVLSEDSGLLQGFDHSHAPEVFGELRGRPLVNRVQELLASEVEADAGPLFLFVNIADAHGPWQPVPESLGWIPQQPGLLIDLTRKRSTYRRLLQGDLSDDEFATARGRYLNAYDFGVYRADRTLGMLLRVLEADGWLDGRYRLVITSDHGE